MNCKALVVDDSGVMRKIIIRSLNALGVNDIQEAANGAAALELFQAHPFDLVMLDWNMPVMNGLEFLKAIRGAGSQTPVILVTTEAERARVLEAIQAGVTDFLKKPFENDALFDKIAKHLPQAV